MFDMLMDEICPDTPTEWLLFADMASLFWELGRYTDWKGAILNIYSPSALETALRETHRSLPCLRRRRVGPHRHREEGGRGMAHGS
jgi:hypothetical protein